MRSHIHELWEDLELSPQYPEPGLDRVMDRVMDQIEAEEPEHPASQTRRRRPMHKKKLLLSLAAALVVLTGSAFAAAYQAGVLDIFFRGDTSSLESYRTIQSTEDENYRLTVDSLRDGDGLYLYLTVEPKTEQATQALPEIQWGPDTFSFTPGMTKGWWESEETTNPEVSRSFSIETNLTLKALETLEPITFSTNFMAEDCTLQLPIDQSAPTASRSINQEIEVNPLIGETEYWTDVTISSTRLAREIRSICVLPQVGQETTSTPPLRSPSVFKINFAERISSTGSPVRDTRIVSPIP